MDPTTVLSILNKALKMAKQIHGAIEMQALIENVANSISCVYSDIANAHLSSAKQAIKSASLSQNHSNYEMISAAGHIRDAINIIRKRLDATITTGIWKWKHTRYLVEDSRDRASIYVNIAIFYIIKAVIYNHLKENQEVSDARKKAISNYKISLDTLFTLKYLRRINSNYVQKIYMDVQECLIDPVTEDIVYETITKEVGEEISEMGYNYIACKHKDLLEKFESIINKYLQI